MKKPVFSSASLLSLLMLFLLTPLSADWYGDWEYEGDTIIDYRGEGGVVTIPHITGVPSVELVENASITAIVVSEGLENIYIEGFYELTYISIPSTVTKFEISAINATAMFERCVKLTEINVNTNNELYKSIDGVLYTKDGSMILRYPCGRSGTYTFPDSVTAIWSGERGTGAFNWAVHLSEITIPSRISTIPEGAFSSAGLTSVTFETFYHPTQRKWFGVEEIDDKAFMHCKALTDIILPRTLTTIGARVFMASNSLTAVGVDPDNEHFTTVDGIVYNKALTELVLCPSGKVTANQIPPTVSSIASAAFARCEKLTAVSWPPAVHTIRLLEFAQCVSLASIRIPSGVTSIGSKAFDSCSALTSAYFSGTVAPEVELDSFQGTSADFQILFREGSTGYVTPYWKGYPCASIPNSAPTLYAIVNRSVQPGQTLTFTVQALDDNEDDLEFSAVGTAP